MVKRDVREVWLIPFGLVLPSVVLLTSPGPIFESGEVSGSAAGVIKPAAFS